MPPFLFPGAGLAGGFVDQQIELGDQVAGIGLAARLGQRGLERLAQGNEFAYVAGFLHLHLQQITTQAEVAADGFGVEAIEALIAFCTRLA